MTQLTNAKHRKMWPKRLASDLVQAWSKTTDTKVQDVFSELCRNERE